MNWLLYIIGFVIIIFTIVDLIWTTLWVDGGAGPLSKGLANTIWKFFNKLGQKNPEYFDFIGPVTLTMTLISWSVLIWLGFAIFFSGDPTSITNTSSPDSPIRWYEQLYYTGFTLFTLGVGDYSPKAGFWQIVTTLNSAIGILFLTLCASYIISVIDSVVQKRSLATSISSLGKNCVEIVENTWNGRDFHNIDLVLVDVSAKISALTQQHHAYPLLHFYHSRKADESASVAIATLEDTLIILLYGLKEENLANDLLIKSTKSSIGTYMDTLTEAFVNPADEVPPIPEFSISDKEEMPLVLDHELEIIFQEHSDRRRKLLGAVQIDHQNWPRR
ncbi:ion channel [Marinilactibacillus piezotolerans]|uniref:ion channel n=1 Tax=Marinilactibacillus piezotolerans TaxID=258723 RepID=UPI0009AF298D|nr:ion channel [Marinilactibacillus piezotolerans]